MRRQRYTSIEKIGSLLYVPGKWMVAYWSDGPGDPLILAPIAFFGVIQEVERPCHGFSGEAESQDQRIVGFDISQDGVGSVEQVGNFLGYVDADDEGWINRIRAEAVQKRATKEREPKK